MLENRYASIRTTQETWMGRTVVAIDVPQGVPLGNLDFIHYRLGENENIFTVATKFYGEPRYFWRIASANPEYPFPLDILPGILIKVPVD